jgi:hypothetical protein
MKVETQLEVIPFKKLHVHWVLSIFSISISHVKKKKRREFADRKIPGVSLAGRQRSKPAILFGLKS